MTNTIPTWVAEFGTGYDVPASIYTHPALSELSWHNDTAPSFCVAGHEESGVRLWVEHPTDRESDDAKRFTVTDEEGGVLFESETDAEAAVVFLLAHSKGAK